MRVLFNEGKTQGVPENVWEEWIKQVDENGDGGVTKEILWLICLDQLEGIQGHDVEIGSKIS